MENISKVKIRFIDCDPMGHLNNSKYIDYMLNAREDHISKNFNFTYEEYSRKTKRFWVITQNEIAYLKEVKYNQEVYISSKIIELNDKTHKVEILMKHSQSEKIHALLWTTFIYFNLETRKAENMDKELINFHKKFLVEIEQKDFQSRADFLRLKNHNL